jgi:hypothetical protein
MLILVPPCAPIPGGNPSRTYYQVLGISPDEQDPRAIEEAALGCSAHVRAYQLTSESECALRLNEIAQALCTLLDPNRRQKYDQGLDRPDVPVLARGQSAPPTLSEGALVFRLGEGGTCDIRLVYRSWTLRKTSRGSGGVGGTHPENRGEMGERIPTEKET